mgnify:CR=1 FL=1
MAIPDHVINLETLQTPYPYTKDGSRRWEAFTDWPDPWVMIGAAALVTTRLRFVTTVYLPAMRDPYSAAKSIGTAAVLADDDGSFVYIVDKANTVQRRAVETGMVTGNGIAIESGLSGNERIVVRAGGFLNPGDRVKPKVESE